MLQYRTIITAAIAALHASPVEGMYLPGISANSFKDGEP
jgi:hypothetical protein